LDLLARFILESLILSELVRKQGKRLVIPSGQELSGVRQFELVKLQRELLALAPEEHPAQVQRIDEDQIVNNAWTPSYYGYDGMGSVRQLTSAGGTVTDTYEYDAFGNKIASSGTTPNNYLYRGEPFDSDLGMYYLRARWYNPQTGRFLSQDPAPGFAPFPKTLHKYLYAGADPENRIDPTGWADLVEEEISLEPAVRCRRFRVLIRRIRGGRFRAGARRDR
jgi:RHS repeat-associated protein